ncbi:tRNA (guanine-N(7)-)-methyltransferase [Alsobacter metallidurans]|uniref:tRNA (guanine-N(7)-)-methyltransferase n=1 Tax=Alsobacter metallidurans TaxID=340221 RepID=A0A917MMB0_9HYPH|nr:tRNA (guanine(46)-N(7))-methyltransferase TrmB [Alsobacter metallidurans]GGH34066.1 tRNA (guanine-N(7)-)-methyltransferase [Alsobacter metallidurans]
MTGAAGEGGAFYGRRKGKKLRAGQADLFETLLPRLRVHPKTDLGQPERLFGRPVREVWLEIGFGGGEHLLSRARKNQDVGFIGCEPFVNGMAKLLAAIEAEKLDNVRLFDGDALQVIEALPDASIARVVLLYPDPWPKRRHHKRRFVSDAMLARLARILRPGGSFWFASDIDHYVGWVLARVLRSPDFAWEAERAADWREPYPGWPSTRYEAKALREGRTPSYLRIRRR